MKEIHHSLTEQDLKNAIYQYLQGLSEENRPRSPDFELAWGSAQEPYGKVVCTVIETREEI